MRDRTPLEGVDVILSDLDGVVYKGAGAIPHAVESLERADAHVGYITNNASRTDEQVAEHLRSLGLSVAASDIVTSPQAAVRMLAGLVPAASTVLVVGGDGLVDEVEKAGFVVTRSAEDEPAAVIQGFAPHVGWEHLAEAAFALRDFPERPWVATNTDWTIPVARGIAPGNGTLVSAVHTAIGRLASVAGKPERAMFDLAVERFGASRALVIGDRLDTDIRGANNAELDSVWVATGIDAAKQLLAAGEQDRPTYLVDDLRGLHEPYPATRRSEKRGAVRVDVGTASVRLVGQRIEVIEAGRGMDLLRAGTALIWGSGLPIYALDVPAALYS